MKDETRTILFFLVMIAVGFFFLVHFLTGLMAAAVK